MKLIDKSALVAEIEKLNPPFYPTLAEKMSYQDAIKDCIDIIYTLKVKEVDLGKELNDFIEQQKSWVKDDWVVEYNNGDSFNHIYDLEEIAKHFFELGIKVAE